MSKIFSVILLFLLGARCANGQSAAEAQIRAVRTASNGGNYSAMWRKSGDSWKLAAELFVSLEK